MPLVIYSEALHYQNRIGGKVNTISVMYADEIEMADDETDFLGRRWTKAYYCSQ